MAEQQDLVGVGPWRGLNNTADETSAVYQIPSQPGDPPAYLREAVNVDLQRDGWISRRSGRTRLLALSDGHSGVSIGGMFLVADGGGASRPAQACAGTAACARLQPPSPPRSVRGDHRIQRRRARRALIAARHRGPRGGAAAVRRRGVGRSAAKPRRRRPPSPG